MNIPKILNIAAWVIVFVFAVTYSFASRGKDDLPRFPKTFDWSDYPEYPRKPKPGSFDSNEVRYMRRYRGYMIAQETLRSKYIMEWLRANNPDMKFPSDAEIQSLVDAEIAHFTGIIDNDPENPANDPDDQ